MRDLFETFPLDDPVSAARRGAGRSLRRRFYGAASAAPPRGAGEAGHTVQLDGKPARTPAGRLLAMPTAALAEAVATEWEAQSEVVDPAKMPLNRLANTIIDGVADSPGPVVSEIRKYLASDLLFYRAVDPPPLREREAQHWDPILAWAERDLGARFVTGEGILHVPQPDAALSAVGAAVPDDPWRLGALHAITTLTGSALLALAVARGRLLTEAAWQAAHVDEDWNIAQWGHDELAQQRRAFRLAEFEVAVRMLKLLS